MKKTFDKFSCIIRKLRFLTFAVFVVCGGLSGVSAAGPLTIAVQPESFFVYEGSSIEITCFAVGEGSLAYQWYRNGVIISGATESSYRVVNASAVDAGFYFVRVSDSTETVNSQTQILSVLDSRMSNDEDHLSTGPVSNVLDAEWFKGDYVLSRSFGRVVASSDGKIWRPRQKIPSNDSVWEMASNGSVLAARVGNNRIAATTNLQSWTVTQPVYIEFSQDELLNRVEALDVFKGRFFIWCYERNPPNPSASREYVLKSSSDGTNWEEVYRSATAFSKIEVTSSYILFLSKSGNVTTAHRSSDGATWQTMVLSVVGEHSAKIVSLGDQFLLTANWNTYTSANGFSWSAKAITSDPDEAFKVGGDYYFYDSRSELRQWIDDFEAIKYAMSRAQAEAFGATYYLNGKWLVGSERGGYFVVDDLEQLPVIGADELYDSVTSRGWGTVSFMDDHFVAIAEYGGMYSSASGKTWDLISDEVVNGTTYWHSRLMQGNGVYVYSYYTGNSLETMQVQEEAKSRRVSPQAFGLGLFVGSSDDGILYSSNGVDWMVGNPDELNPSITVFGEGVFVGVGRDFPKVTVSDDGINWTTYDLPSSEVTWKAADVTYGKGQFVVVMERGELYTSSDGHQWIKSSVNLKNIYPFLEESGARSRINVECMTYGSDEFVAVVSTGTFRSTNLTNWTFKELNNSRIQDITSGNGIHFGVGEKGTLVRFGTVDNLPPGIGIYSSDPVIVNTEELIALDVSPYDLDGEISSVSISLNGVQLSTSTTAPFLQNLVFDEWGIKDLLVEVVDQSGMKVRKVLPFQVNILPENLKFDIIGEGHVDVSTEHESLSAEDNVELTAVPAEGYVFYSWSPDYHYGQLTNYWNLSNAGLNPVFKKTISTRRAELFSPEEILNELHGGWQADPDNDGFSNIVEIVMGSDPSDSGDFPYIECYMREGVRWVDYQVDSSLAGFEIYVDYTGDFVSWNRWGQWDIHADRPVGYEGIELIEVELPDPGLVNIFARVRVIEVD